MKTGTAITLLPKPTEVLMAMAPPNQMSGASPNVPWKSKVAVTQPTVSTDATIKINSNAPNSSKFSWMAIAKI